MEKKKSKKEVDKDTTQRVQSWQLANSAFFTEIGSEMPGDEEQTVNTVPSIDLEPKPSTSKPTQAPKRKKNMTKEERAAFNKHRSATRPPRPSSPRKIASDKKRKDEIQNNPEKRLKRNKQGMINKKKYRSVAANRAKETEYSSNYNKNHREQINNNRRLTDKLVVPYVCPTCGSEIWWKHNVVTHNLLYHTALDQLSKSLRRRADPWTLKGSRKKLMTPFNSQEDQKNIEAFCAAELEQIYIYQNFTESIGRIKYVYLVLLIPESYIQEVHTPSELKKFLEDNVENNINIEWYVGKSSHDGIVYYHSETPLKSKIARTMKDNKRAFLVKTYQFKDGNRSENLKRSGAMEAYIQMYGRKLINTFKPKEGIQMKMINDRIDCDNIKHLMTRAEALQSLSLAATCKNFLCLQKGCEVNHNKPEYMWSGNIHLKTCEIREISDLNTE